MDVTGSQLCSISMNGIIIIIIILQVMYMMYTHTYVYKCAVGLDDPSCTIHEVSMHTGCSCSHVLSITAAAGHLNNSLI